VSLSKVVEQKKRRAEEPRRGKAKEKRNQRAGKEPRGGGEKILTACPSSIKRWKESPASLGKARG